MTVTVSDRCTACGVCLVTCPTRALVPAPRRPRVVDASCTDCWLCIEVCPVDAIAAGAARLPDRSTAPRPAGRESREDDGAAEPDRAGRGCG